VFETVLTIWPSHFAALGPASEVVQGVAATIGAEILLGGFVAGTAQQLVRRGLGRMRDDGALADAGYLGGWATAVALVSGLLVR
jgi:hypothetical protein